jgi:hypothetical protein
MKLQISYPLTKRIREEKTFRTPKNILLQILIFVGIFFIAEMAESMGMIAGVMPRFMDWATQQMENNGQIDSQEATDYLNNLTLDPSNTVIMLFSTVLATIVVLLFCRFVEGRKFRTMGFRKKHGFLQYLGGLAAGFVMFSAVVGLSCLMGGLHFEGFQGASAVSIVIVFIGYGLQGMSEEVICRGYLMTTIIRRHSVLTAVLLNGAVFGFLHVFNDGFSALAFLNLTLYGVMISLYILRTDNLWGACAIHSIWNFVQGNFYGRKQEVQSAQGAEA